MKYEFLIPLISIFCTKTIIQYKFLILTLCIFCTKTIRTFVKNNQQFKIILSEIKHLLVIRLSAMGDVAMAVPVLKALVKQHPTLKITVLSKPFLKPLFDGLKNVTFYGAEVDGKHKGFFEFIVRFGPVVHVVNVVCLLNF